MDLQTLWARIYPKFDGFDDLQMDKIKSIFFSELGKYSIEEKEICTDLANYSEDMKGYRMFFCCKKGRGVRKKVT